MKKGLVMLMISMTCMFVACGSQEAVKEEATQETATVDTTTEETSAETESQEIAVNEESVGKLNDGEGIAPAIDIEGCATFTEIVDKKLEPGMGYANVKIGDKDVILITSGCFNNNPEGEEEEMVAIDATIFRYTSEGTIEEVGKVTCGGTAYPLAIKDGELICGANHWLVKDTIKDGKLEPVLKTWVDYSVGDGAYYSIDATGEGKTIDEDTFWEAFSVYDNAEVITFSVIAK
ncbi:hypothetical protein SAMN02910298_02478 [Pseudobutyrivibrio sp. YE44]|uniref:hypothetical protein n=1 Tax=Pseudobutyrivibrio sp. YE44 TaxID=1520802 RepID=UPI00087F99C2|nr:hypothetical protein [Pseudobutyrivibrio sp. YE44]SDB49295.1 hypothetical protein SAMN02910298_02478 [Pseudobutyrivibrio sp. YE44]